MYFIGHQDLGEEEGEEDQEGEQQPRTGHARIYETRLGSPGVTYPPRAVSTTFKKESP